MKPQPFFDKWSIEKQTQINLSRQEWEQKYWDAEYERKRDRRREQYYANEDYYAEIRRNQGSYKPYWQMDLEEKRAYDRAVSQIKAEKRKALEKQQMKQFMEKVILIPIKTTKTGKPVIKVVKRPTPRKKVSQVENKESENDWMVWDPNIKRLVPIMNPKPQQKEVINDPNLWNKNKQDALEKLKTKKRPAQSQIQSANPPKKQRNNNFDFLLRPPQQQQQQQLEEQQDLEEDEEQDLEEDEEQDLVVLQTPQDEDNEGPRFLNDEDENHPVNYTTDDGPLFLNNDNYPTYYDNVEDDQLQAEFINDQDEQELDLPNQDEIFITDE
jgi:hypothetical protein